MKARRTRRPGPLWAVSLGLPGLLGALLAAGCAAAPACPPALPALVSPPAVPVPIQVVPDRIAAPAAQAIRRDTSALESQARSYAYAPGSEVEVVRGLTPRLRAVRDAVARMEANRSLRRAGQRAWRSYREADIAQARGAADELAHYLNERASLSPRPGAAEGAGPQDLPSVSTSPAKPAANASHVEPRGSPDFGERGDLRDLLQPEAKPDAREP